MPKLIKKERNIVYEYYEIELTEEQLQEYKANQEEFYNKYDGTSVLEVDEPYNSRYIDTTDSTYYTEDEVEPTFNR